ncbi:CaiB/BaiF CoA transferase family protein [Candidatus Poriferisocius sp.]|uniref:CaiB/BaiF CoA transferase family protein n=1 Tax=Candidatus Poriferisocius sp. TaxID=3101276 RepID=UPI003B01A6F4
MGPLRGMRIVELAGIGPTPFAGMMLSDMGVEVIRVDRVGGSGNPVASQSGPMERGKRTVAFDLKQPEGVEAVLRLAEASDGLFEGFRAGVAERLGVGPDACLARNPKLVYGRMTGWGQSGPLADRAGHDINYISLAGPLAHIGRTGQPPSVPLNLIGDFGGGSVFLVLGMVAALLEVARGGDGQVVDAAMVDGAAYLLSPLYAAHASGFWTDEYGANFLDSGAYFYEVYGTADGRWLAVGAIEPQFHAEFMAGIGLAGADDLPEQMDRIRWPEMKQRVGKIIAARTLDEWMVTFDGTDACVTPVLTMGQTPAHPHALARDSFFDFSGATQPRPAPRFEGTPSAPAQESQPPGADTDAVLLEVGYSVDEVKRLRLSGAVA